MFRHSFATLLEENVGIRYIKNSRSQLNFHNANLHARFDGKTKANSLGQAPEE